MDRYSINNIASVITEDPDILTELNTPMDQSMAEPATSTISAPEPISEPESVVEPETNEDVPLQAVEIEKQAEGIAGEEPNQEIMDQLRAQEEARLQMDTERKKVLEPQMTNLRGSMNQLDTGISQGMTSAREGGEAFSALDQKMTAINAIVNRLEKQL